MDPPTLISCASVTRHYSDIIMGAIASQITSLMIVYSTFYSDADQRKHQKLCVTGLCARNSPGTGEFSAQMASNTENVSIWWCHHEKPHFCFHVNGTCQQSWGRWGVDWKKHFRISKFIYLSACPLMAGAHLQMMIFIIVITFERNLVYLFILFH